MRPPAGRRERLQSAVRHSTTERADILTLTDKVQVQGPILEATAVPEVLDRTHCQLREEQESGLADPERSLPFQPRHGCSGHMQQDGQAIESPPSSTYAGTAKEPGWLRGPATYATSHGARAMTCAPPLPPPSPLLWLCEKSCWTWLQTSRHLRRFLLLYGPTETTGLSGLGGGSQKKRKDTSWSGERVMAYRLFDAIRDIVSEADDIIHVDIRGHVGLPIMHRPGAWQETSQYRMYERLVRQVAAEHGEASSGHGPSAATDASSEGSSVDDADGTNVADFVFDKRSMAGWDADVPHGVSSFATQDGHAHVVFICTVRADVNRADAKVACRQGFAQAILHQMAGFELCGARLGLFVFDTCFHRLVVLHDTEDQETIYVEVADNHPQLGKSLLVDDRLPPAEAECWSPAMLTNQSAVRGGYTQEQVAPGTAVARLHEHLVLAGEALEMAAIANSCLMQEEPEASRHPALDTLLPTSALLDREHSPGDDCHVVDLLQNARSVGCQTILWDDADSTDEAFLMFTTGEYGRKWQHLRDQSPASAHSPGGIRPINSLLSGTPPTNEYCHPPGLNDTPFGVPYGPQMTSGPAAFARQRQDTEALLERYLNRAHLRREAQAEQVKDIHIDALIAASNRPVVGVASREMDALVQRLRHRVSYT